MATFGVELLMHVPMVLLEPFLAPLRRAAKLAILGWRISLVSLAGVSSRVGGFSPGRGYLGGKRADCRGVSALEVAGGQGRGRCTAAVDDVSGLGFGWRGICRGGFGHGVGDGRSELGGWVVDVGAKAGRLERWESYCWKSLRSLLCRFKIALSG